MIAPYRDPQADTVVTTTELGRARRLVATTFLKPEADNPPSLAAIGRLVSWAIAAWMTLIAAAYCIWFLGTSWR